MIRGSWSWGARVCISVKTVSTHPGSPHHQIHPQPSGPSRSATCCRYQQNTERVSLLKPSDSPSPSTSRRSSAYIHLQHTHLHLEKELDSVNPHNRPLSQRDYLSLLKSCNRSRSLPLAQRLYADFRQYRLDTAGFLEENLVVTLTKCGALDEAFHLFRSLPHRTAFVWTALISGLTDWGHPHGALAVYQQMLDDGVEPDSYTFVSLFKACAMIPDLKAGKKLHKEACQKGLTDELFVGNTLISMYGKCGLVVEAEHVFADLPKRDIVTWNIMMSVYVEKEQAKKALLFYRQMCEEPANLLDEHTMVFAIQAVRLLVEEEESQLLHGISPRAIAFEIGRALHAEAYHKSVSSRHFVGNTLISMYGNCGTMAHAMDVFHGLTKPDIVSKTAILSAFLDQGQAERALQFYTTLSPDEMDSNYQTFLMALQACTILAEKEEACWLENGEYRKAKSLEMGCAVHEDALRVQETSLFVANTLISMYGKCGAISEAENIFTRFAHIDVVSWNAMVSAYIELGRAEHALRLYRQMHEEGVTPNRQTFLMVLQACEDMAMRTFNDLQGTGAALGVEGHCSTSSSLSFEVGVALHADIRRRGLASDVFLGTALIRMYGKYGALLEAENIFCSLGCVDLISCTAMLSVLVEQGEEEKGLVLYKKMQEEGMHLDELTICCILQTGWKTGGSEVVKQLHFIIVSGGMDSNCFLASIALIHAYGGSGSIGDAIMILDGLPHPDSTTQNACIAANIGEATSLWMFEQMQLECFCPDAFTFTSILSACTHAGLVEAGIAYFKSMGKYFTLHKDVNHFVLMVDLLGRAGDFVRATHLIRGVPKQAELGAWLCLLSACCAHGNTELGKSAFERVVSLQTDDPSAYVLMSNMCVDTGF